jgi:acetyl esterase/lipase
MALLPQRARPTGRRTRLRGSGAAGDLAGLPATFITVGNLDGLLDEDVDYARRLIAAGVPTDLHVFADAPHAFDSMLPGTAIGRRAGHVLEDWLESRLHPQ